MTEMIERVSHAISAEDLRVASEEAGGREFSRGELFDRLARAALEAMREPTDCMSDQGAGEAIRSSFLLSDEATRFGDGRVSLGDDFVIVADVGSIYRAMIDAALTEPT